MMKINTLAFIACESNYEQSKTVLFGAPYDCTVSFRPGARFAPNDIRNASYGLETYSPILNKDLTDYQISDVGDLEFAFSNSTKMIDGIYQQTKQLLVDDKCPIMIGGEHLVTLGSFKAIVEKYPDVHIIHFDAHADLRDNYLDEPLSHACVLRRCFELIGPNRIHQFGIRSMSIDEAYFAKDNVNQYEFTKANVTECFASLNNKPVYVTIDLDVLDPSVFPGTGTPEPGGVLFQTLMDAVHQLSELNVVGADVCELAPHYDHTGVSSVTAAKVIRELLLALNN